MPVWRPAFQAGGVATGAVRSAARGGREAGVAGRGRGDGRGAECGAGRSGGRRCRPVRRRCCWARCRGGNRPLRVGLRRAQRGALRVPVWRPAFQAGGAAWAGSVATGAARSAARGGREAGVASRRRGDGRSAERGAWRSGGRRCRPVRRRCCWVRCRGGNRPLRVGLRCAQRGALRVPVWRPAFQAGGVATGAVRSAARGGRETGVAGRGRHLCCWVRCRGESRPLRVGLRRAQRGALRVPVWRPAFQAGGVARGAGRSAARGGLEAGVASRRRCAG